MTDKTFEEIFPNLKGKEVQFPLDFWIKYMKLEFGTNNLDLYRDDVYGITLKDIQEYCIDKQKIRDAIKKYNDIGCSMFDLDEFKREIGL